MAITDDENAEFRGNSRWTGGELVAHCCIPKKKDVRFSSGRSISRVSSVMIIMRLSRL